MCIAYPARVLTVNHDGSATVDVLGRRQTVLLVLIADEDGPVTGGEWLLVQTGLALARIDEAEAAERTALITETTAPTAGGTT